MNSFVRSIVCLSISLLTLSAEAASETNKTITCLGAQASSAYVCVTPALTLSCPYNLLSIPDLNTAAGRTAYATLLSALATGKPLSRIDYYPNPSQGNRCDIYIVEVQP